MNARWWASLGYRVEGRPAGGQSDQTWFARDREDRPVVVKIVAAGDIDAVRDVAAVVTLLRARGHLIPEHVAAIEVAGAVVQVQERIDGRERDEVSAGLVNRLVSCIDLQAGVRGRVGLLPWGEHLTRTLVEGEQGYCVHESLAAGGARERRLLEWIRRVGVESDASIFPTEDAVHFDLGTHNVLQDERGGLAAVIDWQALEGDRHFDLVTFAHSTATATIDPAVRESLWEHVDARVPAAVLRAYTAHLTLRLVDWTIRHGGPSEPWIVEGERLLARYQ